VNEGQGDLELVSDGRELLVRNEETETRVPLDIRRADRHEAMNDLDAGGEDGVPPPTTRPDIPAGAARSEDGEPRHFGVDGRPATIIQIKSD